MHPVAKRCLITSVVLVILGVFALAFGFDLTYRFQELVGYNAEPAIDAAHFVMDVVRYFALPLAAGLVTATIVIQTLAPRPAPGTEA